MTDPDDTQHTRPSSGTEAGSVAVIMTVTGPVPADSLGHIQPHEHVVWDLRAYLREAPDAFDEEVTLENYFRSRVERSNRRNLVMHDEEVLTRELGLYAADGGGALVDATTPDLGRDPTRLRAISQASGVPIIMGSGYYVGMFHPPALADATVEQLRDEIVSDLLTGVRTGGVRSGVIGEIGMSWPIHPNEDKVLAAAGLAQMETGAGLLIHPGRNQAAPMQHLDLIRDLGVDLRRVTVCHVDRTIADADKLSELADTGAYLEFDLFGTEASFYSLDPLFDMPNDALRIKTIRQLVDRGHRDQILLSQDVCYRTQLQTYGGEGYGHIRRRVIPMMLNRGFAEDDITQLTERNPARFLAVPSKS